MKVLITEKLSEHRYKTPEGYLVCVNAILARTGPQIYKHNQVYDNSTDEITDVEVDRKPEQVFSPQAIASFENKPLTIQHPNEPVTSENHKTLYHGFVRDIRRAVKRNGQILTGSKRPTQLQDGDQEVLVGNIIVTTSEAIEEIENGLEFLSCGYDCDITQTDTPEQINIRGNHVALCDNPRAGITMLQDNADLSERPMKHIVRVLTDALTATHSFVIDEQFIYVTPEYPIDSMNWLKYFAKELRLNVKIQIKHKWYDDKVYIIGRKSDVEKLVAEYNELYRNRKLVPTTSTAINSKRVYNKGYSLGDVTDGLSESEYLDEAIKDFNKTYSDYKVTKSKSTFKGHVNLKIEKLNENANFYKTFRSDFGIIRFFRKHGFDLQYNNNTKNKLLNYRVYVGDSLNDDYTNYSLQLQATKIKRGMTIVRNGKKFSVIDISHKIINNELCYEFHCINEHGKKEKLISSKDDDVIVVKESVVDAINYVVMCEQLYNGVAVKSRAPWIAFRSEDKREAERFVKENNAKMKSLVGFSQRYYIK